MKEINRPLKVVWICHFTSKECTSRLTLDKPWYHKLYSFIQGKTTQMNISDIAVWDANGINEMAKIPEEVELHVISPYPFLTTSLQEYSDGNIHYHFFRNEELGLIYNLKHKLFGRVEDEYKHNRRIISKLIRKIKPEIVHVMGAENPHYSMATLDIPETIPVLVQLQTFLNDPDFSANYPIAKDVYAYKSSVELNVLRRANYIGTVSIKFISLLQDKLHYNIPIINTSLAFTENVFTGESEKLFDFVYWASNINKAADLAIRAFINASRLKPGITLDIIGAYDVEYKKTLEAKLRENNLLEFVKFEGRLQTHDDVLNQIRKSRIALLPLKIDIISGTIREAQANGLPVITTDTGINGTQILNKNIQTALIADHDDYNMMANYMIKLLEKPELAQKLKDNAYKNSLKRSSNASVVKHYIECYHAILENFHKGEPIPDDMIAKQ